MLGVLLTFGSMAFGALVTYFVSRRYYVAAAVDLAAATSRLERKLEFLQMMTGVAVEALEQNGIIKSQVDPATGKRLIIVRDTGLVIRWDET